MKAMKALEKPLAFFLYPLKALKKAVGKFLPNRWKRLKKKSCTSVMVFKRCIGNVTRARAFLPWFAVLKDFPFVKLLVSVVFQHQVF